jgi:hypothetical protein
VYYFYKAPQTREVSITGKLTVSDDHPAKQDDPQASLRAQLLAQIVGARAALEAAIAELSRAGGNSEQLSASRSNLALLGNLGLQISTVNGSALASLRGEVTAAASAASNAAQQARAYAADAASAESANVAQAAAAAREQVNDVMRGMKDFDPYLHFDREADKEAYRRREAERLAYIERQQATGTPRGDLNAANAALAQMDDAKAHGADRSPAFADRYAALEQSRDRLKDTISPEPTKTNAQIPDTAPDQQLTSQPAAQSKSSDLDAAMAAFRQAGVQNATPTDEIAATPVRSQIDPVSRSAASGRA